MPCPVRSTRWPSGPGRWSHSRSPPVHRRAPVVHVTGAEGGYGVVTAEQFHFPVSPTRTLLLLRQRAELKFKFEGLNRLLHPNGSPAETEGGGQPRVLAQKFAEVAAAKADRDRPPRGGPGDYRRPFRTRSAALGVVPYALAGYATARTRRSASSTGPTSTRRLQPSSSPLTRRAVNRAATAGRIRCNGTPALRKLESTNASANPINGTVASRPREGKQVISGGEATCDRAHQCTVEGAIPR